MNTTVKLINYNELAPNNDITLSFNNSTEQYNFFNALSDFTHLPEATEFNYIRENTAINIAMSYNYALKYNYMMYSNDSGRWFYAHITQVNYVKPDVTQFVIETDVLQTYQFEYVLGECFISREHQDRWHLFNTLLHPTYNTNDEGLNYGSVYKSISETEVAPPADKILGGFTAWAEIIAKNKLSDTQIEVPAYVGGISTNLYIYYAPISLSPDGSYSDIDYTVNGELAIKSGGLNGISEDPDILSINILRFPPFDYNSTVNGTDINIQSNSTDSSLVEVDLDVGPGHVFSLVRIASSMKNIHTVGSIAKLASLLNKDLPKNIDLESKLNTNPYSYGILHMNDKQLIINNEYIEDTGLQLYYGKIYGIDSGDIFRADYLSREKSASTFINNKIPLRTDAWLQYQQRNSASLKSGLLTNVGQGIAGVGLGLGTVALSSNPVTLPFAAAIGGGALLNSGGQVARELQQRKNIKQTPDDVVKAGGNLFYNLPYNNLKHYYNNMTITEEYKQKLFNYFYYYGYKADVYKTPDTRSRYYFNHIKTLDTKIISDLPLNIIEELRVAYERGLTIYHVRDINNFNIETQKENAETALIGG
jgi:hypothetical protein